MPVFLFMPNISNPQETSLKPLLTTYPYLIWTVIALLLSSIFSYLKLLKFTNRIYIKS